MGQMLVSFRVHLLTRFTIGLVPVNNITILPVHCHLVYGATMVLEAGYPNTRGFRKVVKATILVKKKPGMSDKDFIEHYNTKHAQMAAPVLEKHNVITYSLVCLYRSITAFVLTFRVRLPYVRAESCND